MPKPIGYFVNAPQIESICGSNFENLTDSQKNQLLLFCALQLDVKPHWTLELSDLSLLSEEILAFDTGKVKLLMQAILDNS